MDLELDLVGAEPLPIRMLSSKYRVAPDCGCTAILLDTVLDSPDWRN